MTAIAAAIAACAGPQAASRPETVSLRLSGAPPNATVTIDDHLVGPLDVVAARGVALPPGAHRISVEAAGYLPYDAVVDARDPARPVRLDVRLVPIPD